MTISELLSRLRRLGVRIWAEDGKLRLQAPKGVLTPELRDSLARSKAELLRFLEEADAAQSHAPPIQPAPADAPPRAAYAQRRLWSLDRLDPGSAIYNMPTPLTLTGRLDSAALERALGAILRRHDILRTVFRLTEDDTLLQEAAAWTPYALPLLDLAAIDPSRRVEEAEARRDRFFARGFDLERGPLARLVLLRLKPDRHLLWINMHHIVADAWSNNVLIGELATLYRAFATGRPSPLPALTLQYRDYAHWQRRWFEQGELARLLGYWREKLAGAAGRLDLPLDRPRPRVQTYSGAQRAFQLDAGLTADLKALADRAGATLFMTLLALFKVLLARLSGQSDIIVGSAIANRNHPGTEGLIGFFINMLPLHTMLDGDPDFLQALERVRQTALDAYAHQDAPFEELVATLLPRRDPARSPFFQAVFGLQEPPRNRLALPGLALESAGAETGLAKYELTLNLFHADGGLNGLLEFNTDLFDAASMERLLDQYRRLAVAATRQPRTAIASLPLMSAAARRRILAEWNDTARPFPREKTIAALFREQVGRDPEAMAVVCGAERLSYGELARRANRLAHRLQALGAGPDRFVAVLAERATETLVAFLAALEAGAAYLPLDPSFPARRLDQIIEDAKPVALLHQARFQNLIGLPEPESIVLETAALEPGEAAPLPELADSENLAYLIYTSGSTGTPKGVAVPHRAVTRLVRGTDYVALGPDNVIAHASNTAFDAATFEIWGAFLNGGRLAVIPRETLLAPPKLEALIAEQAIDTLFLTTALFNQLARETPAIFAGMRQVLFGGEAVDPAWVDAVLRHGPPQRLLHVYGPTESVTYATWQVIDRVPEGARTLPIGKPLANSTAYILDRRLEPVPIGVHGELCLGGEGLARGYHGFPEPTAARFIPHPHADAPGARLYRTGDLARFDEDGAIVFVGRRDHQVKLRGFRIELGDIETALAAHPRVVEATVLLREDLPGEKRLAAYIQPVSRPADLPAEIPFEPVDAEILREHLAALLPDYMVPNAFVILERLPLNPNGKVDRGALPPPEKPAVRAAVAPRNPLEASLVAIWREALKQDEIGIHDDFFELGGHSLTAIQVVSRLQAKHDVTLPMEALFESPTIAELSELLADQLPRAESDDRSEKTAIAPVPRDGQPLPLSFAQQRLWLIHDLAPDSDNYNIPLSLRLRGALDAAALERSMAEIVRRHESLRTVFKANDGQPRQEIQPPRPVSVPVLDLSDLPESTRLTEAKRAIAADAAAPYTLARGPLYRAALLRLDAGDHVFLVNLHHIVADGWSMGVVVRELSALYRAFTDGKPSPLPALAIQYADFAAWQQARWEAGALDGQLAFWREKLAGAPPHLDLPTDRPRPPIQRYEGALATASLPEELAERLERLARQADATPFMALLAGYAALLGRYSGQDDIVVGAPIANRNLRDTENLIGFFVNMLALRVDLAGDPSFTALLTAVRRTTLDAYEHQDVSFEQVVEALQPERDMSRHPIFQAGLVLQNAPGEDLALPGLRLEPLDAEAAAAKWDLHLALSRTDRGFDMAMEYSVHLFSRETAETLLRRFQRLLADLLRHPDTPISYISLTTEADAQLLALWNRTETDFSAEPLIHQAFERQAARQPMATALIFEGVRLSYAELNARANRLAHALMAHGVRPETPVAVCMERAPEMTVALLAALKAGAAYVPLDPDSPPDRLHALLRDLPLALAQDQWLEKLQEISPTVLTVDIENNFAADSYNKNPNVAIWPENAAYMIYTSGSTGAPKLTVNSHDGIRNRLCWMQRHFGLSPDDRVLQKTPYAFDVSVWEFFWTLGAGATLVMARPGGHREPDYLAGLIEREAVSTIHFVPSMLRAFLDSGAAPRCASLKRVICSGEALSPDLRDRCLAALNAALYNLYGPTEAAVDVTFHRCARGEDGAVPIGAPIANTSVVIADRNLTPAPIGVPGELLIGGVQLARGYRGRPDLTAERFTPDPFGGKPGARVYRSGDRARFLPGSGQRASIAFLGRPDHQVKLRGFRIELGEIEATLAAHCDVSEAAVTLREDVPGAPMLAAYVRPAQPEADESTLTEALRRFLIAKLPDYMVPAAFTLMERLPLTPSGKLDRRALPKPVVEAGQEAHVPPRNATEAVLAAVWEEVLQRKPIGVHHNFFSLGGHSLLATQVAARIRDRFAVELPTRELFSRPTVAGLAAAVDERRAAGLAEAPIPVADRNAPLPLSFAQQRLWFLDQLEPGSPFYNIPLMQRLEGPLKIAAVAHTLDALTARHESLRTTFAVRAREPVQVVHYELPTTLRVIDLTTLPLPARQAESVRLAEIELNRPFDLERGPLLRLVLLRLAPHEHILLLVIHHIIADGWSLQAMFRDIAALYAGFAHGKSAILPELSIQYADFAVWQRLWLQGAELERQLTYWRDRLTPLPPPLELPTDFQRPAVERFRGRLIPFALSPKLTAALNRLSREREATLFMTLLAAFHMLLSRYSGQRDIVVGAPIANRRRTELENLIGFFANTLALRGDLSGDPGFLDLLARAKETTLGAYAHQDLPFERLVDELKVKRDMSRAPIFQAMLVLQNAPQPATEAGELSMEIMNPRTAFAKFDLTLFSHESDGSLRFSLEYNSDLFAEATARRMTEHFQTLLAEIAARPEARISDFALMPETERRTVLHEWNQTAADFALDQTFVALIQATAARQPNEPALIAGDASLTYAELDRAANRLAHRLRAAGAGPNRAVGVMLDRSPAMLIAFLAVLKAGGAVAALDPAHPPARLEFVIRDADLPALITQDNYRHLAPADIAILDPADETLAAEPDHAPPCAASVDHLLYIIYTSGSTGQPKGVGVAQRAILNLLAWQERFTTLSGPARTLQFAAFGFCVSFQETLSSWVAGGALALAGEDERRDPERLIDFLNRHGVQRLHLPFAALKQLALTVADTGKAPATLTDVITAGEPLQVNEPLRRLFQAMPGCRLHNQYGASETHVITALTLPEDPAAWPALPSAGQRVANTRIYVLDERLEPMPIGIPGVVYAAGPCLGVGYLGREDLTAEKFLPDPFGDEFGERLYCTGDLGRLLADGALQVLGRADGMVKVQGYRVEPGEVETALRDHPGLKDAAVVPREDGFGGWRLTAYVVPDAAGAGAVASWRDHLKARLPAHTVPSHFVEMAELPVTANGKLDREALPAPTPDADHGRAARTPPRTPTEQIVAAIWSEVLGVDAVGVEDDFFELGGHSMLATQVMSRLREAFDADLALRLLFEQPTLGELSARLAELQDDRRSPRRPPIVRANRDAAGLPLSYAQERLWFLDRLDPGAAHYNLPLAIRLRGDLDSAALHEALTLLARRHEALRTRFHEIEGRPLQIADPEPRFALNLVDLTDLPETEREARLEAMVADLAHRPFDLTTGPLFRAGLFRLSPNNRLLLLNMHHIVSDAWSLRVAFRELALAYRALSRGAQPALPALPLQYADFAVWQREWLRGDMLERQAAFWTERLADAPAELELPKDRPRPPRQTFNGADHPFRIEAATVANLRARCRERGATLFMGLLAGFAELLSRYAGQVDFCIGTPIANRNQTQLEPLIGFFVNTLALRLDLADAPAETLSFNALLDRTRAQTLDAYAHQDIPFEQLVERLQPERNPSHAPIFQVMFALENVGVQRDANRVTLDELSLALESYGARVAKWDLFLNLSEVEDGVAGALNYNVDLFDADTAAGMARHYRNLLSALAAQPDRPLRQLSMLDAPERALLLEVWNGAERPFPQEAIHRLFEAQAARAPDATALRYDGGALSYAELNAAANTLARRLADRGLAFGKVAAIRLARSPQLIVSLLATLKLGAAYAPIDADAPPERVAAILADCGARLLIADPQSAGETPIDLVSPDIEFADEVSNPVVPCDAALPAYIMYTSGTTGLPKGVVVSHRNIARLAFDDGYFPFGEGAGVALLSNPAFDAMTFEVWTPLLRGGRLCLVPGGDALDAAVLRTRIRELGIDALFLTTALFNQLVRQDLHVFDELACVLFGGELATPAIVARLLAAGGPQRLLHVYGPTESTTFALWRRLDTTDAARHNLPIGLPLANGTAYVVDRALRPVPAKIAGELILGGAGLSAGYLGRPALTAAAFVPDPFSGVAGGRLYRTGDRAARLADGGVVFLGRVDRQVKLRGFRIELAGIEACLRELPGVQDARVLLAAEGDKRLIAYVQVREDARPEPAALKEHLAQRLPAYMIPAGFAFLSAFPLTANGKIDDRALARLTPERADHGGEDRLLSPTEQILADIWRPLLGVEKIGPDANFFELGGHSLLATRAISRIRALFEANVPLRLVFEHPRLDQLAKALDRAIREAAGVTEPPIEPAPRAAEGMPLSFAQERLYFLYRLQSDLAAYNLPIAIDIRGELDQAALERCFHELARRHEALRARFALRDGEPVQIDDADADLPIALTDLTPLPAAEREPFARRLIQAEVGAPFDLENGPLTRVRLFRLDRRRHALLLNMDHIISDAWSLQILFEELVRLYRAFAEGSPSPLEPPAVQYADYAHWQRQWLQGETLERQMAWWEGLLADAPALIGLPVDRTRPAVQTYAGDSVRFTVPENVAAALEGLCADRGATLFMGLFSAFAALLSRYAGEDDLCIGAPIANRNRAAVENTVGFFVNTLPLRVDLSGDPGFDQLLDRVRRLTLDAYVHQDIPFEKIVARLQPERTAAHAPLFQVMFALNRMDLAGPGEAAAVAGLEMAFQDFDYGVAKFDLYLSMTRIEDGFAANLDYNVDLFDRDTIAAMSDRFIRLLTGLTATPERSVAALPLLDDRETLRVLTAPNQTARDYPRHEAIHALVERRVDSNPEAVAVQRGEETLSYAALDRRANRLARALMARGVRPGAAVGVMLPQSPNHPVALLAVLKAGAAYVPIDPTLPAERRRAILRDAGLALAIVADDEAAAGIAGVDTLKPDAAPDNADDRRPTRACGGAHPAYIVFTSGTTGRPKGIVVSHCNVLRLAFDREYMDISPGDGVAQASNLSFDALTFEVWSTLIHGGRLCQISKETLLDAEALAVSLRAQRVDTLFITTAMLNLLARRKPDLFAGLKNLLFGGERVDPRPVRALLQHGAPQRLVHVYGPSESTTFSTWHRVADVREDAETVPIGRPIANTTAYVLDRHLNPVPPKLPGELCLGGDGLAHGYAGLPDLTAQTFIPDPFADEFGARLYKTGDWARFTADERGLPRALVFIGRKDRQVKLRGFRIELGEIEAQLQAHPAVRHALAMLESEGEKRLIAYAETGGAVDAAALRAHLEQRLPAYMVPAAIQPLDAFPLTPNGKIDRRALPKPAISAAEARRTTMPATPLERDIARLWAELLDIAEPPLDVNFFDLGGHSLLMAKLQTRIAEALDRKIPMVDLFQHATVRDLARYMARSGDAPEPVSARPKAQDDAIAIIGYAARFPGAADIDAFWTNLRDGVESVERLEEEDLRRAGVEPELYNDPSYVRACAVPTDIDRFDAGFFDMPPREAEITDPQQRIFLEGAWQALEHAGYAPGSPAMGGRTVGLFAGAGINNYLYSNLLPNRARLTDMEFQAILSNDVGFLATRVAYKLGLTGPAVSVQTGCSTSLTAIHYACQSLRLGECDLALAGGVSLTTLTRHGYPFQEGMIYSRDGRTRAFDADAAGAVPGGGMGLVALKPLARALADGDKVHAVIKGSAINNDGDAKAGFTAPSVAGQTRAIRAALANAHVAPETVSYVEAHGTGTKVGDPIEARALLDGYAGAAPPRPRLLGAYKTNIGHPDTASGVAGLLKAALALKHRQLPPTLHFQKLNPAIDFEGRFEINAALRDWPQGPTPRRAGVSSFGIGGTNVHLILEEAPEPPPAEPARGPFLLTLSARGPGALATAAENLANFLEAHPETRLDDAAYTLQSGRRAFAYRRAVLAGDRESAIAALRQKDAGALADPARSAVFLFPRQGGPLADTVAPLYDKHPAFREHLDRCAAILGDFGFDLPAALGLRRDRPALDLSRTENAQPALFAVCHSLAQLWLHWGVQPRALAGHSLGEYVAACLAGVMSLEDALDLVLTRGRLMAQTAPGAMLAASLSESEAVALLDDDLSLAAVNGPKRVAFSGPLTAIDRLEERLAREKAACRRLPVDRAFHSAAMDPIFDAFSAKLRAVSLHAPAAPCLSNLTGTWLTAAQATDPAYWTAHLRQTVRFDRCLAEILQDPAALPLEVGPGGALTSFAAGHPGRERDRHCIASLPRAGANPLAALGKLWQAGVGFDPDKVHKGRRIPLPTYPFERRRYWIEGPQGAGEAQPVENPVDDGTAAGFEIVHERPALHNDYAAPRNDIERQLATIWQEALGIDAVGVHDDFIELGGDSLLATRIYAKIRETFAVDLPLETLLEHNAIAGLANLLAAHLDPEPAAPAKK